MPYLVCTCTCTCHHAAPVPAKGVSDNTPKTAAWQRETSEDRAEILEAAALDTFGGGQGGP